LKIDGKPPVIKDRNDGLMLRVNIGLQKLIEIAAQRRRNYIIDHVNTTRESQVKRQRLFTGYHRIGVAIIPDDEELRKRIEKLEKTENISIPSQWIREAKSRFYFPQKSSALEDVIYPELDYEEAKSLYDKARRDYDQHRSSSRYDRSDDYHSSRNNNRNRYDDRDRDHRSRDRDRYARSRSRERDRDRRTSREDSRFSSSSSHRNDNFRGGGGYSRGGGGGRYSDHRQDSRNTQRGGFHEGGGSNYRGRGGGGGYHNQSNDEWRGGYQQQQRNDFGGGRGRGGGFDNNRNQYNNRGSYHDNQRSGGFRQDSNNPQRGRQFNDYDKNQQQSGGRGFMQNTNSNNFNQQQDRQAFGSRVSINSKTIFVCSLHCSHQCINNNNIHFIISNNVHNHFFKILHLINNNNNNFRLI
jgi:heterogeneous nuclear ribonucleoprotein U-like protein 1